MNRLILMVLAGLSLVLVPCSLSLAEDTPSATPNLKSKKDETPKAEKSEKTPAGVPAPYATIMKELGLEGQQREAFIAKVRERQQALATWKKDNEPQQKLLQQKAADAKANGDVVEENKAKTELKALNEELTKLEEEHQAQLASTLTLEQRGKWVAYNAYTGLMRTYAKVNLTAEQKAQVKDIAYRHAKAFGELPDGDKKAREALRKQILQEIHDQVLTDEQKGSLEPKPKADKAKG